MIGLTADYDSSFVRCHSDAAAFAPDLDLGACVFDFCHFHCSSRFRSVHPAAFESARRLHRCNPPGICSCPVDTSRQVFRPPDIGDGVCPLLRYGRGRTKWAGGTSGSERRDTIGCLPWAIEKYSTNLTSIRNAGAFATLIPVNIGN